MRYPDGIGYKSERGRELSAGHSEAFNSRMGQVLYPSEGFVAPGYPVELAPVKPPPPIPPGAAAAPAAGGTALGGVAAGIIGAVGVGVFLGLTVKQDIDRFKKKSKLPFYDGIGPWDRWDETDWRPPLYDAAEDERIKARINSIADSVDDWYVTSTMFDVPDDFYAPDGRHGPIVITQSGDFVNWWKYHETCPSNPAADRWVDGNGGPTCGGVLSSTAWDSNGDGLCTLLGSNRPGFASPPFQCPATNALTTLVGGYTRPTSVTMLLKEAWLLQQIDTRVEASPFPDGLEVEYGTEPLTSARLLPVPLADMKLGRPWAYALPLPGSEPGLEEQLDEFPQLDPAPLELPLQRPAITLVDTSLGSMRVPVQRVVVAPAPGAGPGKPPPVIVSPPDVGNPEPGRGKEKKANVASVGGRAWIAFNIATETYDFIESMWKGLPKAFRSKPKRRGAKVDPFTMLQDLYDHFEHFDFAQALTAYANNQIEDAIYGGLGQPTKRLSQQARITTGLDTAVQWGPRVANRAGVDSQLPVPVLHWDGSNLTVTFGEK